MDIESYKKFIIEHSADDISRLVLNRDRWPDIDIDMAVTAVACRKKIRDKLPQWYAEAGIIYPDRICAEQSSSSATAAYKADVARRILASSGKRDAGRVADLTGGLGVDSLAFSRVASKVLYNEMEQSRAQAAVHNFRILGASNIEVSNGCASPEDTAFREKLKSFGPDLIYADPARRSTSGNKVFLLEDCSPDILTLLPEIFSIVPDLLLKLSPMADITMLAERLRAHGGYVKEIHVVAAEGECKELLLRVRNRPCGEMSLIVDENGHSLQVCAGHDGVFSAADTGFLPAFMQSPEQMMSMKFLFEPGKALAKAGLFNAVCTLFSPSSGAAHPAVFKAGRSTHLYFTDAADCGNLKMSDFGKVFRILETVPLSRQSMRGFSVKYPKADVTARNIKMTSDELRRKLKVSSGSDVHIFGTRMDFGSAPSDSYLTAAVRI